MRRFGSAISILRTFAIAAILIGTGAACQERGGEPAATEPTTIIASGSSNVAPLAEIWAAAFGESTEALDIRIADTGSSEGIADLLAGRADIAMASRPMSPEESAAAQESGLELRETVVARMGIGVIVNSSNPVSSLNFEQLAEVFSGALRNWESVGGPNQPVVVVRKETGWSPDFFRRTILGDREFGADAVIADSKEGIVAEVGDRPWSIGFTGLAASIPAQDRVRLLKLVDDASGGDTTYALSRPLFFYTRADSRIVEPFLEYVVGSEAQEQVLGTGLYPLE
jgi:phosphate transport system substrate-binding protein